MTNHKNRLERLEKQAKPDTKIYVMMFGDDGRVQSGSAELIGKTREEVTAIIGEDCIIRRVGFAIEEV